MCRWNCGKLGEALLPLLGPDFDLRPVLERDFDAVYTVEYNAGMARKVCRTRSPQRRTCLVPVLLSPWAPVGLGTCSLELSMASVVIQLRIQH